MKDIDFKTFDEFTQMEITSFGEKILYYGRMYGNRDWGFIMTGHFGKKWDKVLTGNLDGAGNPIYDLHNADFIQIQFLTNDMLPYQTKEGGFTMLPGKEKTMFLKGITEEQYKKACEWIEEHRRVLVDGIVELKGEHNLIGDVIAEAEVLNADTTNS